MFSWFVLSERAGAGRELISLGVSLETDDRCLLLMWVFM